MADKLEDLAAAYYDEYGINLYVNDMSLIEGGLFDIKGNWKTPHVTHRGSRQVDIHRTSMTEAQRTFFEQKAEDLGFTVEVHPNNGSGFHWHLII